MSALKPGNSSVTFAKDHQRSVSHSVVDVFFVSILGADCTEEL